MGLDGLEIVLEIEDTFGVRLHDCEYGDVRTVGDLHDVVLERVRHRRPSLIGERPCLSSSVFLRVRRAVLRRVGSSERIRPSSRITDIVPASRRRAVWEEIETSVVTRTSRLSRPPLLSALIVGVLGIETISMYATAGMPWFVPIPLVGLTAVLAFGATARWATELEPKIETFRDLVGVLVRRNSEFLHAERRTWESVDVMPALRTILGKVLCIPDDEIRREARLVEDLGMC